ncbi:hypothetical protein HOY82DRAFT_571443 [Tuber indicum]|nr:hypothetical protein HOY82DRAFT_571443 [Tuber indicum]
MIGDSLLSFFSCFLRRVWSVHKAFSLSDSYPFRALIGSGVRIFGGLVSYTQLRFRSWGMGCCVISGDVLYWVLLVFTC